jgi:hypothetical protein
MFNYHGLKPFYHDPGKEGSMELDAQSGAPIESSSPVLSTQEAVMLLEQGVCPQHTDFVTVTRSRKRHLLKFPVAYFGEKATLNFMSGWITEVLKRVAPVKPNTFSIQPLPDQAGEPVKHIIFEVSSAAHLTAACKTGGTPKQGGPPILFEVFSAEAQAHQQGRVIELSSLAFNVTQDNLFAAMSLYGPVQSIRTKFNSKMTMMNAMVVFEDTKSVEQLKDANTTCMPVLDDVATVVKLGHDAVPYDNSLTLKLASLPRGTRPIDLWHAFREKTKEDQDKDNVPVFSYHSLTMPVHIVSKQRTPEAFVHFTTKEEQQYARSVPFKIDNKEAKWIAPDLPTCHWCGEPGHFQRHCDSFHRLLDLKATRRNNAAIIRGTRSSSRSAPRSILTQATNIATTQSTPSKQPTAQHTTTLSTQGRSYAAIAASRQNNKGASMSNPLTVPSTSASASAANPTPINHTQTTPAASNPPADWTEYFKAQLSRLNQQHKTDYGTVRTEMAQLNSKLDLLLEALKGPRVDALQQQQAPVAVIEDIEIEDAPASVIVIQDSLPPTPQPPISSSVPQQEFAAAINHPRPNSPKTGPVPYSQVLLRAHSAGHSSRAKSSLDRDESDSNRKIPTNQQDPKGKMVVRNMTHNSAAQTAQDATTLQQMFEELRQENARMKEELRTMVEVMGRMERANAERENAYRELQAALEQQTPQPQHPAHNNGNNIEGLHYGNMTASAVAEYRGVSEIGSMDPPTYHDREAGNDGGDNTDNDL